MTPGHDLQPPHEHGTFVHYKNIIVLLLIFYLAPGGVAIKPKDKTRMKTKEDVAGIEMVGAQTAAATTEIRVEFLL